MYPPENYPPGPLLETAALVCINYDARIDSNPHISRFKEFGLCHLGSGGLLSNRRSLLRNQAIRRCEELNLAMQAASQDSDFLQVILGLYWGFMEILEKKMESSLMG